MLPEAGQGALALQVRAGEEQLVARVDDAETRSRVEAERRCVALIGGGCLAPVAAFHDGVTSDGADRSRRRQLDRAPLRSRPGGASRPSSSPPRTDEAREDRRHAAGRARRKTLVSRLERLGHEVDALPADRDRAARRRADRRRGLRLGRRHERERRPGASAPRARRRCRGSQRSALRQRRRSARPTWCRPSRRRKACSPSCRVLPGVCSSRPLKERGACCRTRSGPTSSCSTEPVSCDPTQLPVADLYVLASASAARALGALRPGGLRSSRSARRRRGRHGGSGLDVVAEAAEHSTAGIAAAVAALRAGRLANDGVGLVDSRTTVFITFLTDFGLQDDFVGTCHGVIKRLAPDAQIIDITHGIPPQAVLQGALVLANTLPYMPRGSAPRGGRPGRGRSPAGPRSCATPTAAASSARTTGLLLPAAERAGIADAHELANPAYALESISRTFHGRDLFAPAAAHLARGVPIAELGPPIDPEALVRLDLPEPSFAEGSSTRRRCTSTASATSPST